MMSETENNHVMDETDLLCRRAEIFRSKLIRDFHLLDTITETGRKMEPPKFYTRDLETPEKAKNIMKTDPYGLVKFQVYSNKGEKQVGDRRRNRVSTRNSRFPPLQLFANWIVESSTFQKFILALILINCVILGIQGEIQDKKGPNYQKLRLATEMFDYCAMIIYMIEIFLKWIDNFWLFWKSGWNIFDFFVTFVVSVPDIIRLCTGGSDTSRSQLSTIANNLRSFRILRSLKMVARFQKIRLIIMAVTKAIQAMVFITVLLFIFLYIFAIIGVMFFKDALQEVVSKGEGNSLAYPESFSNIGNALITLFQLFTLDHWKDVCNDLVSISSPGFALLYVLLWIVVGSFIFRNIFVGIMVSNFQSIRNELFQEVEDIAEKNRRDAALEELANHLDDDTRAKKQSLLSNLNKEGSDVNVLDTDTASNRNSVFVQDIDAQDKEWAKMVELKLEYLSKEEAFFCWPKDTKFRYLLILEGLMENIKERQEILAMIQDSLLAIHDSRA